VANVSTEAKNLDAIEKRHSSGKSKQNGWILSWDFHPEEPAARDHDSRILVLRKGF
jgi:hypothetical protein